MAKPFEKDLKNPNFTIDEKWLNIYKSLCREANNSDYRFFTKYTELYCLCANVGSILQKNNEIEGKKHMPFTLEQVDTDYEWSILRAIAWKHLGNDSLDIFADTKQTISICDQYAEGGMRHLYEVIFSEFVEEDNTIIRVQDLLIEEMLSDEIHHLKKEALEESIV